MFGPFAPHTYGHPSFDLAIASRFVTLALVVSVAAGTVGTVCPDAAEVVPVAPPPDEAADVSPAEPPVDPEPLPEPPEDAGAGPLTLSEVSLPMVRAPTVPSSSRLLRR